MTSLLRYDGVQELLDVSRSTVERLMREGELPYIKRGGIVRFEREDIEKLVEAWKVASQPVEAPSPAPTVQKKAEKAKRRRSQITRPVLPRRPDGAGRSLMERLA